MISQPCHAVEPATDIDLSGAALKALLESFLADGRSCRIRANGSSMTPSIRNGDLVTIRPHVGIVRLGDVVAASDQAGGRVLLHRAVRRRRTDSAIEYLLQGDNGCSGEDWLGQDCVLGKVSRVSRAGRNVVLLSGLPGLIWGRLIQFVCRWRRGDDIAG